MNGAIFVVDEHDLAALVQIAKLGRNVGDETALFVLFDGISRQKGVPK